MQLLRRLFLPYPIYHLPPIGLLLIPALIYWPIPLWCLFVGYSLATTNLSLSLVVSATGIVTLYIIGVEIWRWVQIFRITISRKNIDEPKNRTSEDSNITKAAITTIASAGGSAPKISTRYIASDENWLLWDITLSVPVSRLLRKTDGDGGDYYHTIIEFKLDRSLPRVIFDSKKFRGYQYAREIDGVNRISFEGYFDSSFQCYCPSGYTLDTLSFITPEVLEALLEIDDYDFEIVGDSLLCIAPLLSNDKLVEFKLSCETLFLKLNDHIHNYRDSFVARSIPSNLENHPLSASIIKASWFNQPTFITLSIFSAALIALIAYKDLLKDIRNYWFVWLILILTLSYGLFVYAKRKKALTTHQKTIDMLNNSLGKD